MSGKPRSREIAKGDGMGGSFYVMGGCRVFGRCSGVGGMEGVDG